MGIVSLSLTMGHSYPVNHGSAKMGHTVQPLMAGILAASPARDVKEFVTELRNLPEGWLFVATLAIAVGICWVVGWMYRREGRVGASPRARTFLAVLRCAVFLTLMLILLEPVRVRILRRWIDSYTLLLIDSSSSMDLADRYAGDSPGGKHRSASGNSSGERIRRADIMRQLLENDNRRLLKDLTRANRVKLFTFADDVKHVGTLRTQQERPIEVDASADAGAVQPVAADHLETKFAATGPATNVERAIRRSMESLGGAPTAAIVVLSDGGFNQGAPAGDAAGYARERRIPIHAVGIGDPAAPQNVRIAEVDAPQNAFQQDPFPISVQIVTEALDGVTLPVQLMERNALDGTEGAVVETREMVVGPGGQLSPITFQRRQTRAGRFIYTVQVPVLPAESVADDNSRSVTVNVIESRTRALIIAGSPSWDYQYVSRLLQRDDTFDVSLWLQSADENAVRDGDVIIDHLPVTAEEMFAYDVIVLMDPDPSELSGDCAKLLDRFVSQYGGGLLYTASRLHTTALLREPALAPFRDLLPVSLDPEADLVLNRIGYYQTGGHPLMIPDSAIGHPVLDLGDDPASNRMAWSRMGEVFWHYPVLREKPAATVLIRHGDPRMKNSYGEHVLCATQFVGSGRSGFLAFDGTYRWRRFSEAAFNRFWFQLIRHLGEGKILGGTRRGSLFADSEQVSLGQAVTVTARLFNIRFEPLVRDEVTAEFGLEGEKTDLTLSAKADRPGWFEGRFAPDRVGNYRIRLQLPDAGPKEPAELVRELRVTRPNLEIIKPRMDREALVTLAERSAGGQYYEMDQAGLVPSAIPDLHEEVSIRSRPTSLWDNHWMLMLLVGLLSAEWAVRKWKHLL